MVIVLLLASLVLPSQPLSTFTGTWVAEHKGTIYMRLAFKEVNGVFQGEVGTGSFKVDTTGAISDVLPISGAPLTLSKFSAADNVLTFFRMGDNDIDEFRLKIMADGQAELTFHLSEETLEQLKDEGIPLPRPIVLRRSR